VQVGGPQKAWLVRDLLDAPLARRAATLAGPAAAILAVQLVLYPMPLGVYLLGVVLGLLGALVAVGMALVYRANRILNFAQADLGFAPSVLAVNLIVYSGLTYLLAVAVGLVAALALGALIELAIIRRFFHASRLILTVATIGLAQLLTVGALLLPMIWDERPGSLQVDVPWSIRFDVSPVVFSGDDLLALIVAPLALLAVAAFLRFTSVGMAVRASAERADRASLLGIPVRRIQTLVWALAALLSFIGVFLRAGVVGLPSITVLGFGGLLFALAALMLGRLDDLPAVALAAVALGVLEQGVAWNNPRTPEVIYLVVAVIVVVTLALRRRSTARSEQGESSSWRTADEVRPIPVELRRVPEVRLVTWGAGALAVAVSALVPIWLGWVGGGVDDLRKATGVAVFALVALSVIVLTGWAGQVSLGQMAFAGFGGAVGALAASEWGLDMAVVLLVSGVAGSLIAVIVGLPALRLRGLFLAVVTLAFALAASAYLLNPKYIDWIPKERFDRPTLFGTIDLANDRPMYWVALSTLGLAMVAVQGIRRSRTGRVLLAQRENERAAQSYGINVVRAKLTAFALSGFLAALAGALLTMLQQQFSPLLFAPESNFVVFTSAVVGGLGSLAGAVLGALFLQGGAWYLRGSWQLLPSAAGVLIVLMVIPGGLAGLIYRWRDAWLRSVARRHDIVVPSMVADVAQEVAIPTIDATESPAGAPATGDRTGAADDVVVSAGDPS
jgi:branched-chain amino acid transport system permease protein